jgi:GNAT superfamily N-acetyltransferase
MTVATAPWLERKIAAGDYQGWLAIAPGGSIVAGLGLWLIEWQPTMSDLSGRRGMILKVYTEPAHRRLGTARRLMQTALDWCRKNQINVVILHATEKGRPLYAGLGFKPTNEMRLITENQ